MKNGKIPYDSADLEVIRFESEDVLTTSNIDKDGVDWNGDDWGTGW